MRCESAAVVTSARAKHSSPTTMGTAKVLLSYAPKEAGGIRNGIQGRLQELQGLSTLLFP